MSGKCFTVFEHFWTTYTHTSTNEIWCSYRRMLVNHWHYILLTNNLFVVQHPCFVLYMIAPSITMQCWSNQFILRRFLIVFLAGVGLFFYCKATRCRLLWSVHSHLSIKKPSQTHIQTYTIPTNIALDMLHIEIQTKWSFWKVARERFQNLQAPGAAKKQININKTVKKAHRRNQKHNIPNESECLCVCMKTFRRFIAQRSVFPKRKIFRLE